MVLLLLHCDEQHDCKCVDGVRYLTNGTVHVAEVN